MTQPWDEEPATESPVSISQTIKFGSGYDAPWLVARGPDAKSINGVVDTPDYKVLVETTAKVARYAQKVWAGEASQSATASAPALRTQPDRTAAPSGETKFCRHGERSYKEGVNKSGKTYKGFFCPSSDRDDQCSPEWAK